MGFPHIYGAVPDRVRGKGVGLATNSSVDKALPVPPRRRCGRNPWGVSPELRRDRHGRSAALVLMAMTKFSRAAGPRGTARSRHCPIEGGHLGIALALEPGQLGGAGGDGGSTRERWAKLSRDLAPIRARTAQDTDQNRTWLGGLLHHPVHTAPLGSAE